MIECPNCKVINHPIRNTCAKCGQDIIELKKEWKKNNPVKKDKSKISEYDYYSEKQTVKKEKETVNINIFKKTTNISKSFLNHMMNGFRPVNNSVRQERLDICKKCELYQESNKTCKECGCYLEIKTSWVSESCPEGKWGPESGSNPESGCGGCGGKKT
jgi:ribosomal protein L32